MVPIWRKAAALELSGDYYPLTECNNDPTAWYACQFDDPDTDEGFVQIIRNTQAEDVRFTVNPVVHPNRKYRFVNAVSGETILLTSTQLEKGLNFHLQKRSGEIWFYKHRAISEE